MSNTQVSNNQSRQGNNQGNNQNNTTQGENREPRQETDYSKLDVVNISFRRPAKWYMYVVKRVLKVNQTVDIRARPSAAAQVVRVAEALKRLGYVSYVKYYTTSSVVEGALQRFIVVSLKKTAEFDKLYSAREEERTKRLEQEGEQQGNRGGRGGRGQGNNNNNNNSNQGQGR